MASAAASAPASRGGAKSRTSDRRRASSRPMCARSGCTDATGSTRPGHSPGTSAHTSKAPFIGAPGGVLGYGASSDSLLEVVRYVGLGAVAASLGLLVLV